VLDISTLKEKEGKTRMTSSVEVVDMINDIGSYKPFGFSSSFEAGLGFEGFAERFMELLQDRFATLYRRVSEPVWNNGVYSCVRRAYYTCFFDLKFAEYYVPTVLNGNTMQYHRVAVHIVPELDDEKYEQAIEYIRKPVNPPAGKIDSNTVFIVAPKVTRRHAFKVWKEKLNGMLKIKRKGNCMAIPIVSNIPEIAFKKLITHVVNFWDKRVRKFLEKLKIEGWMYDYDLRNIISNTLKVLENYNSQIVHSLRSMVAHLLYLMEGLKEALKLIGWFNKLKIKIVNTSKYLTEALNVLDPKKREEVLKKLEETLASVMVKTKQKR
jgi:hypothetical protein